jgi:hypothetical protein
MTLSRIGGLAALLCAATYISGFALLLTVLAPLGFGSGEIDAAAVARFIDMRPGLLIAWNTTIYIVNALALLVLVTALARRLSTTLPGLADLARATGLVWAALVLGAGMIANVAVERTGHLYATDPDGAVELWSVLHSVELGLGGGNEIAGGVWIMCVSFAAWRAGVLPRAVSGLGLLTGGTGLATVLPPLGDGAGSVFGLGAILWFVLVGAVLVRAEP